MSTECQFLALNRTGGRVGVRRMIRVAVIVLAIGMSAVDAHAQWTVTSLHPAGTVSSEAYGVGDGQQVGAVAPGIAPTHAVLWSGDSASWIDLNPAGCPYSYANGVSGGQQVGGALIGGNLHASLWSGSAVSWVDLSPMGATLSVAWGVDDGRQVGYALVDGQYHASLWNGTAESWLDLSPAGSTSSSAISVSGGQQAGYALVDGQGRASIWSGTPESWVDITPAGAIDSAAYGIHGDQQVGYAYLGGEIHAGLWNGSSESWIDLNPVGLTESTAWGVFNGQQVGHVIVRGRYHASFWNGSAESWVDLSAFLPPVFTDSGARGIWSDGDFVYVAGYGIDAVGNAEALLWTRPVPEPSTAAMLGFAFSYLGLRQRRTKNRDAANRAAPLRDTQENAPYVRGVSSSLRTNAGQARLSSWRPALAGLRNANRRPVTPLLIGRVARTSDVDSTISRANRSAL